YVVCALIYCSLLFFFTAPSRSSLYTLSLHDALPILARASSEEIMTQSTQSARRFVLTEVSWESVNEPGAYVEKGTGDLNRIPKRSEEHTSELQSLRHLVCRLLLEKKKIHQTTK